jgi:hypothetical protein
MKTPTSFPTARLLVLAALSVLIACVGLFLPSCADCFFEVDGKLTDCSTNAPVAGATITVRIENGLHGQRTLPATFVTDSAGAFMVHSDGTETCGTLATLMFRKDGYSPLDTQVEGGPSTHLEVCMSPVASP